MTVAAGGRGGRRAGGVEQICRHTSNRVFFSATSRPVFLSRALYTLPYVPSPTFSIFS